MSTKPSGTPLMALSVHLSGCMMPAVLTVSFSTVLCTKVPEQALTEPT